MRQTLKRLTKMTVGYGLVQWIGPFLSFIFTPIITRILTVSAYGITDYLMTISSAAGTVAAMGLPSALTAHFNDHPDPQWKRMAVGTTLALALPISFVGGLGLVGLAPAIIQSGLNDQLYTSLLQLIGATFIFGVLASVLMTAAQADLRVRWGMVFSLTTLVCTVSGNVLFIIVLRLGVTGMILTPVLTGVIVSLVALFLTRPLIGRPSPAMVTMLLRSGIVLLPTLLSNWALQLIDRLFLVHFVTTTQLGYYSIANKAASLLYIAMTPIYNAWTPLALAIQREESAPGQYQTVARYLMAIVLTASLGLGLFATEILLVFAHGPYLPAAPYVGPLTYTHVISAISTMLIVGGLINKQLGAISSSIVVGAIVNLFLNYLLIPPYGVWGAIIATLVGYAVPVIILYWRIGPRLNWSPPMRLFLAAIATQLALMSTAWVLPPLHLLIRVGIKLAVLGVWVLASLALGLVKPSELRAGLASAQRAGFELVARTRAKITQVLR